MFVRSRDVFIGWSSFVAHFQRMKWHLAFPNDFYSSIGLEYSFLNFDLLLQPNGKIWCDGADSALANFNIVNGTNGVTIVNFYPKTDSSKRSNRLWNWHSFFLQISLDLCDTIVELVFDVHILLCCQSEIIKDIETMLCKFLNNRHYFCLFVRLCRSDLQYTQRVQSNSHLLLFIVSVHCSIISAMSQCFVHVLWSQVAYQIEWNLPNKIENTEFTQEKKKKTTTTAHTPVGTRNSIDRVTN